jgi:hypothetical protein
LRTQNLKLLDSPSDADLDEPTKAPPKGLEQEFATYGQSSLVLALHQTTRRGNATDARRAAGLTSLVTQDVYSPAESGPKVGLAAPTSRRRNQFG